MRILYYVSCILYYVFGSFIQNTEYTIHNTSTMNFQTKEIYASEMVGGKLRALREERKLSIESISFYTKIQKKYLAALEANDFEKIGNSVYVQNFIKAYSRVLGVPHRPLIELYRDHRGGVDKPENQVAPRCFLKGKFVISQKFVRNIFFAALGFAMLIYVGLEVTKLLMPPPIAIYFPPDNYISAESKVEFSGRVDKEAALKINGQEVVVDESGNFKEKLDLGAGLNLVKIGAQRQHSEERVVYWRVFYGNKILRQR